MLSLLVMTHGLVAKTRCALHVHRKLSKSIALSAVQRHYSPQDEQLATSNAAAACPPKWRPSPTISRVPYWPGMPTWHHGTSTLPHGC